MPWAGLVLMRSCKAGGPRVGPNNSALEAALVWPSRPPLARTKGRGRGAGVTRSFVCAKSCP